MTATRFLEKPDINKGGSVIETLVALTLRGQVQSWLPMALKTFYYNNYSKRSQKKKYVVISKAARGTKKLIVASARQQTNISKQKPLTIQNCVINALIHYSLLIQAGSALIAFKSLVCWRGSS